MKWHDAREVKPKGLVIVKGRIGSGLYAYMFQDTGDVWMHIEGYNQLVSEYPFYATEEEVEKELDSDE